MSSGAFSSNRESPGAGGVDESEIATLWADALDVAGENDPEATLVGSTFSGLPPEAAADGEAVVRRRRPAASGAKINYTVNDSIQVSLNRMLVAPTGEDGDFVIRERLGQGGMGIIYTTRQTSLDREVAVKMIVPGLADRSDVRQKMISEALVTGQLDHPNIIPIYELGQTEGDNLFYAMKVVQGQPWSVAMKDKSRRENVEVLLRVADAVAFAHAKGIIHRDLKPANVMVGDFGEVLVMDWGLAVGLGPEAKAEPLSPANAIAGTPSYMAPEMARGRTDMLGPLSDIYLLGAILFEIATGKRPHPGDNHVLRLKAAAENTLVEHDRNDELVKVALRAMATDPKDRYQTVKELQNAVIEVETHSESLVLTRDAAEALRRAETGGLYEFYSQACFAYREARRLWPGNTQAILGEADACKKYAACAFGKGDFDLALANLKGLDDPDAVDMAAKVVRARAHARTKRKRVRMLIAAALGLASGLVLMLAFAGMVISDRMDKEREALRQVEAQRYMTRLARKEADAALERERRAQALLRSLLKEKAHD